ncbi:MAG: UDP-N-acetylmuramoyl-L-alanyl-D-glutamate--2,6-diaminopimelate ligase [Deltaproteobacteria bacterium RIFCSPLOWO2_12_FULL_60_19]|nr:MAG: UDP-N-acetylmuramoyl-L-alanyl-D-glutamate--2,6-diaminopimelate ligase [Deltaproteobacteria bacterium RIFCSPLOWO2_12_FULL_60_19]
MRLSELFEKKEVEETGGDLEQIITGLVYDSRTVKRGDVFFAVPGLAMDGHDFITDALARGAAAVVVERKIAPSPEIAWIRVPNVRRAMALWAARFYGHPSRGLLLAGVTGTNGKTTITYLLESIFRAAGMLTGVIGTINYRFGSYRSGDRALPAPHTTPESVDLEALLREMADSGVQAVAMEVSSHALELERVAGLDFDTAIFTNLTRDHLDFHGDMERYFAAKSRLFLDCLPASCKSKKTAVIHGGDAKGRELLERVRGRGLTAVSYGHDREWDVHPLSVAGEVDGLRGKIQLGDGTLGFSSRLIGSANLENILAAAAAGFSLGLKPEAIARGLERLASVPGRLERVENRHGFHILVDYAHTPDALERALQVLRPLTRGRLIAVFGCGGDRDRGKRPMMGEIAARLSDIAVVTSDNPRSEEPLKIIAEIEAGVRQAGMPKSQISDLKSQMVSPKSKIVRRGSRQVQNLKSERGYFIEPDRRAAIRSAIGLARPDDLILIAGKGHEDYQLLGAQRIRFDDREVAREELARLAEQ